jgi:nucleoside diphosphate kinase
MIKPEAVLNLGCIMQRIEKCFRIIRAKMAQMDYPMVSRFYQQHEGQEYFA